MLIWEVLKALLQGVVQGITEWLPISSTGHLILVERFLPFSLSEEFFKLFEVLIQLGSILAVVVVFFNKLNPFSKQKTLAERNDTWRLWLMVVIASIPTAIMGLAFKVFKVDDVMETPWVITAALIIYGILFIVMESCKKNPRFHTPNDVGWKTAFFIGCFQTLALIPGTSRSGSTILGALLLGCSRYAAAEFSFFMAIPAMAGASAIKALGFFSYVSEMNVDVPAIAWAVLAVGAAVAFVVSMVSIKFLTDFVKKHSFIPFGVYRIILGAALIVWFIVK